MPLDLHCTACAAETPVGQRVALMTMEPVCPTCPWIERERVAVEIAGASAGRAEHILSVIEHQRGSQERRTIVDLARKARVVMAIRYGGVG